MLLAALKEGFIFYTYRNRACNDGGILIGTPLAMMRLSNNALASNFAKFYVDLFRGIPLIQVIFIFISCCQRYLSFNQIRIGAIIFQRCDFCHFEAAFFSEIVRSGIQSISKGKSMQATL